MTTDAEHNKSDAAGPGAIGVMRDIPAIGGVCAIRKVHRIRTIRTIGTTP